MKRAPIIERLPHTQQGVRRHCLSSARGKVQPLLLVSTSMGWLDLCNVARLPGMTPNSCVTKTTIAQYPPSIRPLTQSNSEAQTSIHFPIFQEINRSTVDPNGVEHDSTPPVAHAKRRQSAIQCTTSQVQRNPTSLTPHLLQFNNSFHSPKSCCCRLILRLIPTTIAV